MVRTPRGGICQQRKLTHPSAIEAMDKFRVEKVSLMLSNLAIKHPTNYLQDIAQYIKKEVRQSYPAPDPVANSILQFDSRKGATWHCVVGRNFGSFVTHGSLRYIRLDGSAANGFAETKHFIYFYLGHCAILLFKTQ